MSNEPAKDEVLLIDFVLGRCEPAQAQEVQRRLEQDAAFRRLHDDLRNTFAAMDLAVEHEPPESLVARTMG